jgi:hypothetical protein
MSIKYPRTPHMPFSPGYSDDEEELNTLDLMMGKRIIITEKMDGENTTLYRDHWHARGLSTQPRKHESRDWMANYWANGIKGVVQPNVRICGENLYAKHSIHYKDLPTYFMAFSVWDEHGALSWDQTVSALEFLSVSHVPVLYDGPCTFEALTTVASQFKVEEREGFVARLACEIPYSQFGQCVAKWVRPNHVQLNQKHWFNSKVTKNLLRK